MTDPTPTPDGATPDGTNPNPDGAGSEPKPPSAEDIANLTKALEKERDLRKAREKDLNEFRNQQRAAMNDNDRALAEAREQAAAEVRTQYGQRLAQTEFRAAAAARNPDPEAASKALRYLNLSGLLGDDGEPDGKAIAAAVADLIPEAVAGPVGPPSFDGGARTTAQAGPDMNRLMRQAIGRA